MPFCVKKCPYCDFYSVGGKPELISDYVNAVRRNIRKYKGENIAADTVYFGGGTPSLLQAGQIGEIISEISDSFRLADNAEISIEANPGTVDRYKLRDLKSAGINRISFGVQSVVDSELAQLGRIHTFEQARSSVLDAFSAGIENISCDLMLGIPNQTPDSLSLSIDSLCALPIKHVSAYVLKIESGTPFDCDYIKSRIAGEELSCDLYLQTAEKLSSHGFLQYEISNFAALGFESRHNLKYWRLDDYIGIGPSAHSYFKGVRFAAEKNLLGFISSQYQKETVTDPSPDKLSEYIMLSLRLCKGIDFEVLKGLGGNVFETEKQMKKFEGAGLAEIKNNRAFLTPKGFLVSNSVICDILNRQ